MKDELSLRKIAIFQTPKPNHKRYKHFEDSKASHEALQIYNGGETITTFGFGLLLTERDGQANVELMDAVLKV